MSESELIKDLIEQPAKVYVDKNDYQQGFIDGVNQMIKELGAVRQIGKWEFHCQHWSKCSICGYADKFADKWNYCPNCGAKMENVEKSLLDIKRENAE